MKKKLPIGIDGFEKIRTNDFYYVDKTMFIAELLHNWGEVNLFTRPRRFGKSLNMSMLKYFFEIGSDKTLFDGLNITKEKDLCEQYMGKFPVISITLKGINGKNYQEAYAALRRLIGREASRFSFLSESPKLLPGEKELYYGLANVKNGIFTMSDEILIDSIHTLSELLFKHYGRKVILLIDEYDVPLDKAFQNGYYEEMISLIRNLFGNALKTNDFLYFAVLTGCLRISRESIFTGLNNLNVMTITDAYFNDAFGFTENDVEKLLTDYGLEDAGETMRNWYDGYQFGGTSIYCPWDVIKYTQALLKNKHALPENYWANTSGNTIVRRFIGMADRQTRSEIEHLIAGESIIKSLNQELTYNELDSSIDNLWSILFTTGYLTCTGERQGKLWNLAIPNQEIQELFVKQVQEWFKEETRTDTGKLRKFCEAFPAGDAATIENLLNEYLWKCISIRDTAVKKDMKENFYHGILLGLLQYESNWKIESNAESSEGYSDISIKTQNRIGIIVEIKYAENGNLQEYCTIAVKQMKEKQYDEALRRDGMKKIVKYGIAFYKKNCKVMIG